MSLLGLSELAGVWIPEAAAHAPDEDRTSLHVVCSLASEMLQRGGKWHAAGQLLADAYRHLDARLLEGRVEAAEVRYALGLPMSATVEQVVCAIKVRS